MQGKSIHTLTVGDSAYTEKTISESDVYLYAGITGDLNSVHINAVEADKSVFKKQVAHGMLSAGLISTVLGMHLPGPGAIYLGQTLEFLKPVFFGDTIRATATILEIIQEKNIVKLDTTCTNQNGDVVIKGVATVRPPR